MVKKNTSKEYDLRIRMYRLAEKNPNWRKNDFFKHFNKEGVAKSTIYDILRRMENNILPERKSRCAPPSAKMTESKIKLLKDKIDHHDGISQSDLAEVFGVSQPTICRTIKKKTNIRYYKKKKAPKRTDRQKAVVRPFCARLVRVFRKKKIIIDDESYFGLSNYELSGNAGFYSSNIDTTPIEVKIKRKEKFEPKLLVWVAISTAGITKPYIAPSGQAINQDIYIEKCLRSRLIPFIKEHHKNDNVVFWPDLASSHYAEKVQDFLIENNIEFVDKERNIANTPELRPIEDFWSKLKRAVYDNCWKAENLDQLRHRIEYCLKKFDHATIHHYASRSFTRVDKVRREGMENL